MSIPPRKAFLLWISLPNIILHYLHLFPGLNFHIILLFRFLLPGFPKILSQYHFPLNYSLTKLLISNSQIYMCFSPSSFFFFHELQVHIPYNILNLLHPDYSNEYLKLNMSKSSTYIHLAALHGSNILLVTSR